MEVTEPRRKATVEKAPLYMDGARRMPSASATHSRLKPSSEPSSTKMMAENPTMKTAMYWYSVVRKDTA